jgi:hypothetical protein
MNPMKFIKYSHNFYIEIIFNKNMSNVNPDKQSINRTDIEILKEIEKIRGNTEVRDG